MDDTRRIEHEQFVSGHGGGSVLEISLLVTTAPAVVLLRQLVCINIPSLQRSHIAYQLLVDFLTLVMPILCVATILSDQISAFLLLILTADLTLFVYTFNNTSGLRVNPWLSSHMYHTVRRPGVTAFRSYVNIATAVCILGVDFPFFPRRLAKAETFGTGLMDVGVGSFVVSNAIVSAEARGNWSPSSSPSVAIKRIFRSIISTLPLWVLGFCRLVAVKGTNYHEHASEYGTHWNFFFTLAVVRVASSVVLSLVDSSHAGVISLLISLLYQWTLSGSALSLRDYILTGRDGLGSRHGIIDANREGLLSCAGYLAIYFGGVQLGRFLNHQRITVRHWIEVFVSLVLVNAVCWILLYVVELNIDLTSRRMANLAYVIWMMAYNIQLLASFLLVDIVQSLLVHSSRNETYQPTDVVRKGVSNTGKLPTSTDTNCNPEQKENPLKQSKPDMAESRKQEVVSNSTPADDDKLLVHSNLLLESINHNGLFYFLLTNLLTGLVNFSMSTIHANTSVAFVIMTVYLFVLSAVSMLLHVHSITIKFW